MVGVATIAARPSGDARISNTQPNVRGFALLALPLALLLVVFKTYSLEQPEFFVLSCLVFGGFAVSYWLPFHLKEKFFILLSLAGAYVLLGAKVASLLIGIGFLLFAIVRSPLPFRWKVAVLLGLLGLLAYGRATGRFRVPLEFWPVFGAVFMFRTIVYVYDTKHQPGRPALKDFLSYFFLLPSYYFTLFPVIDFQTFRKSYFQRDIHAVAQEGVWWIWRGTTHLLAYRLFYQLQPVFNPSKIPVAVAVAAKIVLVYLLYVRVSGQFHISVGMLHLFGYNLPETMRKWCLANGINDYWRRANIYFTAFMTKICYFPVYFKLRRKSDVWAKMAATLAVFFLTWVLHGYQFFWLENQFRVNLNDTLFWGILGAIMVASVWFTRHSSGTRKVAAGWSFRLQNGLRIAAWFALIATLWSLWSAEGVKEWFYFLRTGKTF